MNMTNYPLAHMTMMDEPDEETRLQAQFEERYNRTFDELSWMWRMPKRLLNTLSRILTSPAAPAAPDGASEETTVFSNRRYGNDPT